MLGCLYGILPYDSKKQDFPMDRNGTRSTRLEARLSPETLAVIKRAAEKATRRRAAVRRHRASHPRRCRSVCAGGRCERRSGGAVLWALRVRVVFGEGGVAVSAGGDGEEGGGGVSGASRSS